MGPPGRKGRPSNETSYPMKTLREIQDQEELERKVLMVVMPIGFLVVVYLLIGTALLVTQRWASPCWPDRSTIHDRDTLQGNALQSFIHPVFAWGPRFVEHVVRDDMPIRHFVFASDCQWSGQLPARQRLFAQPSDAGGCPGGTVEIRGQRCGIPPQASEPVVTYRLPGLAARCPAGWVRAGSTSVALSCVLPSLQKPAGGACPRGFVAWSPGPDTDQVRTVDSRGTPFPPNTQVCRLADG